MRMTRDTYAKEVWKVVEAMHEGDTKISCPHENCTEELLITLTNVHTGIRIICPEHGLIFRE